VDAKKVGEYSIKGFGLGDVGDMTCVGNHHKLSMRRGLREQPGACDAPWRLA